MSSEVLWNAPVADQPVDALVRVPGSKSLTARWMLLAAAAIPAVAQTLSKPQPIPFPKSIPDPVDTPYPGTIRIDVDATDNVQGR